MMTYLRQSIWPLALAALILLLHWPGVATYDSYAWLRQARTGDIIDMQPLGAPLFLMVSEHVVPGFLPFILANILIVVLALDGVLRRIAPSDRWRMVLLFGLLFYPPVAGLWGVAWRDVTGLGLTLATLAAGLVMLEEPSLRRRIGLLLLVAVLTALGSLFRDNHVAGAVPYVALACWLVLPAWPWLWRGALAAGTAVLLCTALTLAVWTVSDRLIVTRTGFSQVGMMYELARMSLAKGENLLPPGHGETLPLAGLEAYIAGKAPFPYDGMSHDYEFARLKVETSTAPFPWASDPAGVQAIREHYRRERAANRGVWLQVMLSDSLAVASPWNDGWARTAILRFGRTDRHFAADEVDFTAERAPWSLWYLTQLRLLNKNWLPENPVPYLGVGVLVLLAAAWRLGPRHFAASPSGIVALLSLAGAFGHFLTIVTLAKLYDFRWMHQTVFLCLLAIVAAGMAARGAPERPS